MTIHLTDFAKSQIRTIFFYYKEVASVTVARKIKSEIDKAILSLKDFHEQGQEDEYMIQYQKKHRRLVTGNYKIIYRIQENQIFITDVFDSRQSPSKMKP